MECSNISCGINSAIFDGKCICTEYSYGDPNIGCANIYVIIICTTTFLGGISLCLYNSLKYNKRNHYSPLR